MEYTLHQDTAKLIELAVKYYVDKESTYGSVRLMLDFNNKDMYTFLGEAQSWVTDRVKILDLYNVPNSSYGILSMLIANWDLSQLQEVNGYNLTLRSETELLDFFR